MRKIRSKLHGMFKHSRSGSVMVEFALCLPFVITLLYVVVDAYNYYYWSNKVKNCTYIVAGLLQNAYKKKEGTTASTWYTKGLEPSDIKNICKAAMLSIPIPHNVMNTGLNEGDVSKYPVPIICLLFIQGTSETNATVLSELDYQLGQPLCFYSGNGKPGGIASNGTGKIITALGLTTGNSYNVQKRLFPGLSIATGEQKVLIYTYIEPNGYKQVRKYFGLYLIIPSLNKAGGTTSTGKVGYFLNMLAFTPAPGLFDDKLSETLYDVVVTSLPSDSTKRSKFTGRYGSKIPVACYRAREYSYALSQSGSQYSNLRYTYGLASSQISVMKHPSGY